MEHVCAVVVSVCLCDNAGLAHAWRTMLVWTRVIPDGALLLLRHFGLGQKLQPQRMTWLEDVSVNLGRRRSGIDGSER